MTWSDIAAFGVVAALVAGPTLAAEMPASVRQAGVLHLSINSTYAPMEYHDPATNELKGLDVDLAEALAKRLDLRIEWTDVPFDQLIPSLTTGRTDFIISGLSDRQARRDTADFVDYLTTGPQFFVLETAAARALPDLCGLKIGTVRSTSFPIEIEKWSKANCEGAGKAAVQYVPGENSIDVRNQLKQGRIDAAVQGSETLPYAQANEPGKYRVIGEPIAQGLQGIAFRKDSTALRAAVTEALSGLMADGSYRAILVKWGLSGNASSEPRLNAATQ